MMFEDGGRATWHRILELTSAVHVPATVCMVPIPPDVTGRMAMFWNPRTLPKEKDDNRTKDDPPCLGDCTHGPG